MGLTNIANTVSVEFVGDDRSSERYGSFEQNGSDLRTVRFFIFRLILYKIFFDVISFTNSYAKDFRRKAGQAN